MNRIKIADAIAYLRPIADSAHVANYKTALTTVIEAAKKQIPYKIKEVYSLDMTHLYRCRCGRDIMHTDGQFETNTCFTYCPGCGQRLEWPKSKKK